MIYDKIRNLPLYASIHPAYMEKVVAFFKRVEDENLPDGKYELDGKNLFVNLGTRDTGPDDDKKWEAHRLYADIQAVLAGAQRISYCNISDAEITEPYKEDIEFFRPTRPGIPCDLYAGDFIMLFPEDLHQPDCVTPGFTYARKAVVKWKL